jgi:hypothetical protein
MKWEREVDRETDREIERDRERQSRDTERDRQRERETERVRDIESEIAWALIISANRDRFEHSTVGVALVAL